MSAIDGWIILLVPFCGLIPILRDGKWNWAVTPSKTGDVIFWIGWFFALFVGTTIILGS